VRTGEGRELRHHRFAKRLRRELPVWVERGWVTPGGDSAILEHVVAQGSGFGFLAYAFSILGVLLLGSGIITYFAANWALMPKIIKLVILFGGMWAAYGIAAYLLRRGDSPHLGQAILLLGVMLFGANIMLIAQIYHIDSHYPDGVLSWSAGALLAAYLLRSQPAMIAALGLGVLWTGMETLGFERVHWPFLMLWMACLPMIYRMQWRASVHVALLALLVWSVFVLWPIEWLLPDVWLLHVMQWYVLAYGALFLLGLALDTYARAAFVGMTVQRYAAFAGLMSFYSLTFPDFQTHTRDAGDMLTAGPEWFVVVAASLAWVVVLVAAGAWHRQRARTGKSPAYLALGQALLGLITVLLMANLFLTGEQGGFVAVLFNVLFFGGTVWLIYAGSHLGDRFMVNIGFVFFALGLFTRYFDTFWTLLNRSYFFMLGGVLLLVGGFFVERQRRRLTAGMAPPPGTQGVE